MPASFSRRTRRMFRKQPRNVLTNSPLGPQLHEDVPVDSSSPLPLASDLEQTSCIAWAPLSVVFVSCPMLFNMAPWLKPVFLVSTSTSSRVYSRLHEWCSVALYDPHLLWPEVLSKCFEYKPLLAKTLPSPYMHMILHVLSLAHIPSHTAQLG